ncbi:MAG: cytochrome c oxidase subunit 3 [Flavobacteriales bacterium]|jgi:cytochrome c oxidase subunit 3|nr:cytochrome c oxidase subunit 3 [Flavobacteriales bacterium]
MTQDYSIEKEKGNLTEAQVTKKKSRKPLLVLGMASMAMMFVGLSSAYIVSKNSMADHWTEVNLTPAFLISTILVVISSVLVALGSMAAKNGQFSKTKLYFLGALILGITFAILQFVGFDELVALGHYPVGSGSAVASSYIYAMVLFHLAHMVGALISVLVVVLRLQMNKYTKEYYLGIELAAMFWHFLGFIWIYLYIFLNTMNTVG